MKVSSFWSTVDLVDLNDWITRKSSVPGLKTTLLAGVWSRRFGKLSVIACRSDSLRSDIIQHYTPVQSSWTGLTRASLRASVNKPIKQLARALHDGLLPGPLVHLWLKLERQPYLLGNFEVALDPTALFPAPSTDEYVELSCVCRVRLLHKIWNVKWKWLMLLWYFLLSCLPVLFHTSQGPGFPEPFRVCWLGWGNAK